MTPPRTRHLRTAPAVLLVSLLTGLGAGASAQAPAGAAAVRAPVRALRVEVEPVIDGRLDEACWTTAPPADGFVQREPRNGEPATLQTVVRVAYTGRTLVIGARLADPEPARVVGTEYRRDAELDSDDNFQVFLDTFYDRRNAFFFQTNPLGTQRDGLVRNEGEDLNWQWDGIWTVASVRESDGWTVEMAIPFSTLRFPAGHAGTWAVNFGRVVARSREESYYAPISRDFGFFGKWRVSAFADLEGVGGVQGRARIQWWPYVVGGWDRDYEDDTIGPGGRVAEVGVDAKVALGASVTADITVNTDFAQVEADQQQVNVTRFALFFPEKRTFFLENAGLFRVGERSQPFEPPTTLLFFSRRIGLSEDGDVVPILGGVRVTGKLGRWDVGAFDIVTDDIRLDEATRLPRTNFAAVRVKRDVFARSSVGAMYLGKTPAEEGPSNQVLAVDSSMSFGESFNVTGYLARSWTPGLGGSSHALNVDAALNKDRWGWGASYADIGEDFNAEMGFVQRTGVRKYRGSVYLGRRPPVKGVRQVFVAFDASYITTRENALETLTVSPGTGLFFTDGSFLFAGVLRNAEGLTEAFEIREGVEIPIGEYWNNQFALQYMGNRSRRVSVGGGVFAGQFFGGTIVAPTVSVDARVHQRVVLGLQYQRNDIDVPVPGGAFTTNVAVARATVAFSPRAVIQALAQRDDDAREIRANVVFRWTYKPGADVFVVYDDTRGILGERPPVKQRKFLVKVTLYAAPG